MSSNNNNWLLSLKIVLISTGAVSVAVALKLSLPVAASQLPSLWSSLLSWLTPPYLYIVINFIIISIVASSKLHTPPPPKSHHQDDVIISPPPPEIVKISAVEAIPNNYTVFDNGVLSDYGYNPNVVLLPKDDDSYSEAAGAETVEVLEVVEDESKILTEVNGGDDVVKSRRSSGLQRKDSMEFWLNENQKPPVSSRFNHRKNVRASPEGGKSLGVSKPKRHDTLESTWKTITDGRSVPLTRHLKKSDTWDRRMDQNTPPPPAGMMHKSETFLEWSVTTATGSPVAEATGSPVAEATGSPVAEATAGKLRKEPSLSQDELNRRVEAFINKFNEEMRLQRQESLAQYQEMARRGAQAPPLAH